MSRCVKNFCHGWYLILALCVLNNDSGVIKCLYCPPPLNENMTYYNSEQQKQQPSRRLLLSSETALIMDVFTNPCIFFYSLCIGLRVHILHYFVSLWKNTSHKSHKKCRVNSIIMICINSRYRFPRKKYTHVAILFFTRQKKLLKKQKMEANVSKTTTTYRKYALRYNKKVLLLLLT